MALETDTSGGGFSQHTANVPVEENELQTLLELVDRVRRTLERAKKDKNDAGKIDHH